MKMNRLLLLLIYMIVPIVSCLSQEKQQNLIKIFNQSSKDLIIVGFLNIEKDSVKQTKYGFNADIIYSDNDYFISSDIRRLLGGGLNKQFAFFQKNDTMVISIHCGHGRNFFFKDMPFRKGQFNVDILRNDYQLLKGDLIINDDYLEKILFINSYVIDHEKKTSSIRNVFWDELDFLEIDMQNENDVIWEPLIQ